MNVSCADTLFLLLSIHLCLSIFTPAQNIAIYTANDHFGLDKSTKLRPTSMVFWAPFSDLPSTADCIFAFSFTFHTSLLIFLASNPSCLSTFLAFGRSSWWFPTISVSRSTHFWSFQRCSTAGMPSGAAVRSCNASHARSCSCPKPVFTSQTYTSRKSISS